MASMKHLHPYGNSQPNHFQINTDVSTWFIEDKRVYRVENISYVSETCPFNGTINNNLLSKESK